MGSYVDVEEDANLARALQAIIVNEESAADYKIVVRPPNFVIRGRNVNATRSANNNSAPPMVVQGVPVPPPAFIRNIRRTVYNGTRTSTRTGPVLANQPTTTRHQPSTLAAELSDGSSEPTVNKSLLYVLCEINDRMVELMVDTGASTSVISLPLIRQLGLENRLNTRVRGVASGVGTAQIVGRIEKCPIRIGHAEFLLYFSVLETDNDMLILGIDQMRRFHCLLDLEHNKLIFGGKGGVEIDFFTRST